MTAMRAERSAAAASISRREKIYRKASGAAGEAHIPEGGGAQLPSAVKKSMEPALGADLSNVRVHTGGGSAQAASDLGARAFTVGNDVHFGAGQFAPGTKEGDRLIAHEMTHTVQHGKSVQRKADAADAKKGVSQPGEPSEKEADSVADHVTDQLHGGGDKAAPKVQAQAPQISRKKEDDKEAKPDPQNAEIQAQLKPQGITPESPLGQVVQLLIKSSRNQPVTPEEKDQATSAVNALDPAAFSTLMNALQLFGLLETFMKAIGGENAKKTSAEMAVEIPVPAVGFGKVTRAIVEQHYQAANKIFEPHNMKIKLTTFTDADRELKHEGGTKKMLGNPEGTVQEGQVNAKDGQYPELVGRVIHRLQTPGTLTSFWFHEILKDPNTDEELAGRAIREAEDARFKGREAVFVEAQAAENVLAHELGHVLGGKSEEANHKKGADGSTESGDKNNLMSEKPEGGKQLTPEQVQAFKTSIYGHIGKVQIKPGEEKKGA